MKCHFCQNELIQERSRGLDYVFYEPCLNCSNKDDVLSVYTSEDYCQIYVGLDYQVITIPGPRSLPMMSPCHFELGRKYQIRLHLKENFTNICETTGDNVNQIMTVPGFPINPKNAKEKLRLYLTFS